MVNPSLEADSIEYLLVVRNKHTTNLQKEEIREVRVILLSLDWLLVAY